MNENFGNTPPLSPLFRILQFCTHHPHFSTHFHFSTTIHHDADAVGKTSPVSFFTSNVWLLWILLLPPNLLSCFSSKPFHFFPGKLVFACFYFVGHGVGEVATMTMMTKNWGSVSEEENCGADRFVGLFISGVFSQFHRLSFVTFFHEFFQGPLARYKIFCRKNVDNGLHGQNGAVGRRKRALQRGGEQRRKLWLLFQVWAERGKSNAQGELRYHFWCVVVHGKEKLEEKIGRFCLFE